MATVLITDGLLRKTLAMTRSLGAHGHVVYTSERIRCTPSAWSKHCRGAMRSPDPRREPEQYARWLLDTLSSRRFDWLIPSDDAVLDIVMAHREQVEALTTCVLPPTDSYRQAADKYETMQLARTAGVPHPETRWPVDVSEVRQLANELQYPAVIKPRKSSGSRGIRIVQDAEELIAAYQEISQHHPRPMIQEFIPAGERYDVCLMYNRAGQLRCSFVQKEVRHFPVDIGPSTVQQSVSMPELVAQSVALIQYLPWYGVVEIEFMRDPRDGVAKLMEINPRFWNSLEMAIQAGVDFPHLLYQVARTGEAEEVHEYEIGRYCRNLLPGDLLHFLSNPERRQMNPPLLRMGGHRVQDDMLSWTDPMPVLGFAASAARLLFDRSVWKMMFKR